MNQRCLSHLKTKKSKKEPERQHLYEHLLDDKGLIKEVPATRSETSNPLKTSQKKYGPFISNERRKAKFETKYTQLRNHRQMLEFKMVQDNTRIRNEINFPKNQGIKQCKLTNCFKTDMREFPIIEDSNQTFKKMIIHDNQRFFEYHFQNKDQLNKMIFNSFGSSNFINSPRRFNKSLQYPYFNLPCGGKLMNNQITHECQNLTGKRPYHCFSNDSLKKSTEYIKNKNDGGSTKKEISWKKRSELGKKQSNHQINLKKVDLENEHVNQGDFIEVSMEYCKSKSNKDAIRTANKSLETALNKFMKKHKDLVTFSRGNSSKEFVNNPEIIYNRSYKNNPKTFTLFSKKEKVNCLPKILQNHKAITKNIINNSFLRDVDSNNRYLKQLQNNIITMIKRLFRNNKISYNRENIFTLLNLQVPLNEEIFQKMSLKVKLRVFCMIFTKFVNKMKLCNICENFFLEIDFLNPHNLKKLLLR